MDFGIENSIIIYTLVLHIQEDRKKERKCSDYKFDSRLDSDQAILSSTNIPRSNIPPRKPPVPGNSGSRNLQPELILLMLHLDHHETVK